MASKAEHVFSQIRSGYLSEQQIRLLVEKYLPTRKKKPNPAVKPKLLAEVMSGYVQEHVLLGKWTEKTRLEVESCLAVFSELVGIRPVSSLDRKIMVEFLEKVARLPANMNKKVEYRDKTVLQILDMQEVEPMSSSTVNKYLSRVGALMLWCVRQGYIDRNPAEGLSIASTLKEEEERKAYSLTDIQKVISSLGKVKNEAPERYFVPLVAMYGGMRLNEICQLYLEDVKEIEGVWCFDINGDGDKRLKNKASRRLIPVHPELVRHGFLEYVEVMRRAGHPRLWMNLNRKRDGYGHDFSKWYQRHNRKHVTQDPKKVFHSFRHLVADTLKQKGVAEGIIAEILGHANHSITTGRYGKRYRPSVLLEALEQLNYGV
jgi:integrase